MATGHNLNIQGDFNLEYKDLHICILNFGLINIVGEKHGKGPRTHNISTYLPIYCIFGIANFDILRGGILSFGRLLSDHKGVWVNIIKYILFKYNPPQPVFHSAHCPKLNHPRLIANYLTYIYWAMKDSNLFHRMDMLRKHMSKSSLTN